MFYQEANDFEKVASLQEGLEIAIQSYKEQEELNENIKNLNEAAITEPSFISKNEILFMNSDKIMLCFNLSDLKEEYTVTQC